MDYLNLGRAIDPVLLMSDLRMDPDPWQRDVLRSNASRLAILCGRQMGKSLVTACKAIHRALYNENQLILLISRSQDQSDELYLKIMRAYDALDRPVKTVRQLASEIILANGSRIVALPNNAETVRGYSDCNLLIIDEASRVPDSILVATLPMIMASSGDVILLSTPCGRSGFFYSQWTDPHGRWEKITAKASECPRFDPVVLAEVRRELGPLMAQQELECQFLQSNEQIFSSSTIDSAFDSDFPAIAGF
jgi:Terminase large subunit, T4likevirus-type, N-terminal